MDVDVNQILGFMTAVINLATALILLHKAQ